MSTAGRRGRRHGFTLVELLVVIAIIGVLAAILMPVIRTSLRKAKEHKTRVLIGNVEIALKSYETQYQRLPARVNTDPIAYPTDEDNVAGGTLDDLSWYYLVLTGTDAGGSSTVAKANPRRTVFLDVKPEDTRSDGNRTVLVDAWDRPLIIAVNDDGDQDTAPPYHNRRAFDIWSFGEDGVTASGEGAGAQKGDVSNWK